MQRLASLLAVIALASSAALLAGCPSKPKYPECNTDDDCKEQNQVCVDRQCKECRDDKQCKEGFTCKNNACVPKPQCAKNEDCPAGQKCADGKCAAECSADADCGEGKACQNGRCAAAKPKPIACGSDDDCPADAACVNGACQSGAARRVKCQLKPVHFDFDQAHIKPEERSVLDQDVECLRSMGAKRVRVEGHADERGTTEYNIALGNRRANSVKTYLTKALSGIDAETVSYGKERPVDPGHGEEAWAKNRRAEIAPQ